MNQKITLVELALPVKAFNALTRAGFWYAEEIAACTAEEIASLKFFQKKMVDTLAEKLADFGLSLSAESTGTFFSVMHRKTDTHVLRALLKKMTEDRAEVILEAQVRAEPKFFTFEWFERPAYISQPPEELTRTYVNALILTVSENLKAPEQELLVQAKKRFADYWQMRSDEYRTDELPLSNKACNFLYANGLLKLTDLLALSETELYDCDEATDELVEEILSVLRDEGLSLSPEY